MHPSAKRERGFSLTELMIVVVIVGILAAVGMPAYNNYAREAKRKDAHQALLHIASQQERFFTDANRYATTATELGYASATPTSNEGYWQLAVSNPGGNTTFLVTATPAGSHVDATCVAGITLNNAGVRAPDACW